MYEVQTRFANDQFENCWTDDTETPVRFRTYREARTELTQYLKDQHLAVEIGDMLDKYPESDFRIVEVGGLDMHENPTMQRIFVYESMDGTLDFAESLGWTEPTGYPHHDRDWEPDDADGLEQAALEFIEANGYKIVEVE